MPLKTSLALLRGQSGRASQDARFFDRSDPEFRSAINQIDVCIVAGRRPALLRRTLESFESKLFRHFRVAGVYANIDPVFGDLDDHRATVDVIRSFFPEAKIEEPQVHGYCTAVKRNWERTTAAFILHIEDDWLLHFDLTPADLEDFCDPSIAQISFNTPTKRWDAERGEFHFTESRAGSPTPLFAISPGFLRGDFARRAAELYDTALDPEKQFYKSINQTLQDYASQFRVKVLSRGDHFVVTDIGRLWRSEKGIEKRIQNGTSVWTESRRQVPGERNSSAIGNLPGQNPSLRPAFPLVAVIVINWNYGRFVGQAIDSIRAQTYPNFEAVVVDNASDDDSLEVIERHIAGDARFRAIRMDKNELAMKAALRGLRETTGEFVCFVDADDYLFPDFLARHLQVHVALSPGVAFTSSNVTEVSEANEILCGRRVLGLRTDASEGVQCMFPPETVPRLEYVSDDDYALLQSNTFFYPSSVTRWLWGPGTSNVFRRSMLDLVSPPADAKKTTVFSVDGYFCRLCHWVAKSAVIDLPSSAYRIHGSNVYSSRPSLHGVERASGMFANRVRRRRRYVLAFTLEKAHAISSVIGEKNYFRVLRRAIKEAGRAGPLHQHLEDLEFFNSLSSSLPDLFAALGLKPAIRLLRSKLPASRLRDLLRAAYGDAVPRDVRIALRNAELRMFIRHPFGFWRWRQDRSRNPA